MKSLEKNSSFSEKEKNPRLEKIKTDISIILNLLKTLKSNYIFGRQMFDPFAEKFVQDYIKQYSLEKFLKDFDQKQ